MKSSFLLLGLFLSICSFQIASSQADCPSGWVPYNSKCWFFSHNQASLSWTAAESWCQQNNGHLASFSTVEERDWVVQDNLENWDDERWWIGLNDIEKENTFTWSDGTPYDPTVSNWEPLEPNNAYLENCVEIYVNLNVVNDQQWNDRSCDGLSTFVCKRDPGSVSSCPTGYQLLSNKCYSLSGLSYPWLDAQQECRKQGANLVSIESADERAVIESLVGSTYSNTWIGLSDTATPNTLKWVDGKPFFYTNWADGQPGNTLPFQGSTCTEMNYGLSYKWNLERCSVEKQFVCERGLKAQCPPGWLYLQSSGKCYEFVVNPNRVQTWTTAKELCSQIGGGLLKIESQDEENFVGSILESYTTSGHLLVYFGLSDIGHDDSMTWWDQSTIAPTFWNENMPRLATGRDDCGALYAGKSNNNWETTTCFEERAYICELPEGQSLPSAPVVTVDGKCLDGWRHSNLNKKCYFFGQAEYSQTDAEAYCVSKNSHLTSILDENELSFIIGQVQGDSWIGLKQQGGNLAWIDNENYSFKNWKPGEPNSEGNCVIIDYNNGEWNDKPCSTMFNFVCKMDQIPTQSATISPPTYVPDVEKCGGDNWISDPSSNRCYKVNLDLRSWADARIACQLSGGDLASLNSPEENNRVNSLIQDIPSEIWFWIGATDQNSYNVDLLDAGWRWSDGSAFNFIFWDSGEPNNVESEDCVFMYATKSGAWNDDDCYKYHPSICEKIGNMENIVGPDVTDDNCNSNEACCFKHLGAEYGGALPDSAMSASSEQDKWFTAERGRLNTPADVVITDVDGEVSYGNGHGAWQPRGDDTDKWLQVDLPYHSEVKGIVTQGRNGIIQYLDRQWVTSYKVSYSQDAEAGKWEFISDAAGQPVIFKGNADQDTQVTNLFPRPVIARHVRCHPVTWKESPCMRLEYIGCKTSCLKKLGMNSGLIPDSRITASSSKTGKEAKQARAPVDNDECLTSGGDSGASFRGWISRTKTGKTCQAWSSQEPHRHTTTSDKYPQADLRNNYCRNPNGRNGPWCYTTDPDVEWEYCDIPVCPAYTPSGWAPATSNTNQYIQIQFDDYFKISGVTLYKSTSSYVTTYLLSFSDNGGNFNIYQDQTGSNQIFKGLDNSVTEYTDILREPISTMYVRLMPQTWVNEPLLQFELNGCYVDSRITCADSGNLWKDQGDTYTLECPAGCVEDPSRGTAFGTDIYTLNSAVCPAAVHAGKVLNNHGGTVIVKQTEGQISYSGTYRNGIQSQDYGEYLSSFQFSGDSLRCDDGWRPWQNHCYYLSMKGVMKTWYDARSHCLQMGGDLASILSNGENSYVEGQIYVADLGGDVWIGLNDLDVENYYQWTDGSPVTITKWFFDEPKIGKHRCVNIYRFEAYWNDKSCDETLPYLCKKEKQLLPPLPTDTPIADEGCDIGWSAYKSSCYRASTDEYMFIYANHICEESQAKLAGIHDDYEQAFIFSLVLNTLPPGLGYTSWIGLTAKTTETGSLYYEWENGEQVTYTHWDEDEPDVRFSCAFPFVYQSVTYYECTTVNHPAQLENTPWCSVDPIYRGVWINCNTGYEYGCTFMDDQTGYWKIDICGQNRYYVCEKDRVGYTQPVVTTPSTSGSCSDGWYGDDTTGACYQINESTNRTMHLSWSDALDYCRAQRADLVSIHSVQEEEAISNFVTQNGVYSYIYFWIGLSAQDITAGYEWTDGTPVSYTGWTYGEPSDHNGQENCVESGFSYYSPTWNDLSCTAVRNWICKIPKGKIPLPPPSLPKPGGTENSPECGTDEKWIKFTPSYGIDKCYLFMSDYEHGWSYAERNCTGRGGHLVAIHSDDENAFLLSRAAYTSTNVMWIGLRDVAGADGRTFGWSDNSTLDYINWAPGEPNNYEGQEDCSEIDSSGGLWNDDNCGVRNAFICEKYVGSGSVVVSPTPSLTGGCPAGFKAYGNKCWWIDNSDALSWFDVIERCNNMSSSPAVIQNSYEQAFVTSQLRSFGLNVWIGLSGRIANQYTWQDQSEVTYTNWQEYEPNGYYGDDACVEVLSSGGETGKWSDTYCTDLKNYACYTKRSASYPVQTPPTSVCADGYVYWGDACYKLVDNPSTRSQAQAACQNEGSNVYLMSIADIYENNLFKSRFWKDIGSGNSLWTGLTFTTETQDNGQSDTVFRWDDGWPVAYTNWANTEPDSDVLATGTGCVQMTNSGAWMALPASSCEAVTMPFICKQLLVDIPTTVEMPDEGSCGPGFIIYGSSCYYIEQAQYSDNYRSWYEADVECQLRGAALASFHSIDESQAIINALEGTSHNLFIGLSSDGFTGWRWSDGSGVDFLNWVTGEPNGQTSGEHCVEMYPWSGQWNDVDCFIERGYVCKKPITVSKCGGLDPSEIFECGYVGISVNLCLRRTCCYDAELMNSNFSGCYYPKGTVIGPSGHPVTEPTGGGGGGAALETGAIIGIVAGVLAVIIICGVVFYCQRTDKLKNLSLPSLPTISSTTTKSDKSKDGFDNPVVSLTHGIETES